MHIIYECIDMFDIDLLGDNCIKYQISLHEYVLVELFAVILYLTEVTVSNLLVWCHGNRSYILYYNIYSYIILLHT